MEKFVDMGSIDPVYFDTIYTLRRTSMPGGMFTPCCEAPSPIAASGIIALSRAAISRREHPIAIMPMGRGLVVHTRHEERELNDFAELLDTLPPAKSDPGMVRLAAQLIDRQTGIHNPADVEGHCEARLRAVAEAKLKGEGIKPEDVGERDRGNAVDPMAALRKGLGQAAQMAP